MSSPLFGRGLDLYLMLLIGYKRHYKLRVPVALFADSLSAPSFRLELHATAREEYVRRRCAFFFHRYLLDFSAYASKGRGSDTISDEGK